MYKYEFNLKQDIFHFRDQGNEPHRICRIDYIRKKTLFNVLSK